MVAETATDVLALVHVAVCVSCVRKPNRIEFFLPPCVECQC